MNYEIRGGGCGESTLTISPEYIVVYILTTVIEMKCFNMLNVSDT